MIFKPYFVLFRWLMAGFYLSFLIIVPFCYVKIYRYRQNLKVPGSGQRNAEVIKFRRSRNIVTFSYNITIWSVEAVSTCIVILRYIIPNYPCNSLSHSRLWCAEFWSRITSGAASSRLATSPWPAASPPGSTCWACGLERLRRISTVRRHSAAVKCCLAVYMF